MRIVQKYGGTSVGSLDCIRRVAAHISATRSRGDQVVVVASAMAGETDRLLGLVEPLIVDPDDREIDIVAAAGEQVSVGLITLALHKLGVPAVSLMSPQIPIVTDGVSQRARIKYINAEVIDGILDRGKVAVVPGFQGIDAQGNLTTLGRGGSDTSAVALAAAVSADVCEIYTDVDGICTADPRLAPLARRIERMEYEELLEMAGAGAKVVHMRAVHLATRYQMPLKVLSSLNYSASGTRIQPEDSSMESTVVTGITSTRNEAKIAVRDVPDRPGVAHQIFAPLSRANINLDMIVQTTNELGHSEIGFTVAREDLRKTMQLTEQAARDVGARRVEAAGDVSKISIIGLGMRSHAGVAARMFEVLSRESINIQLISTSEIKVSVVVNMSEAERALRSLHHEFGLDRKL